MASASKASKASKEGGDDLLPGIPNHLTMHHIAPKLKWETAKVFEMINKGWQQAMQSRSVYEERVRSHSTDPYLVLLSGRRSVDREGKFASTLYSCKDKSFLRLPPIPTEDRFVFQKCVCLDGKIYLWVLIDYDSSEDSETRDGDSSVGPETEDVDSREGSETEDDDSREGSGIEDDDSSVGSETEDDDLPEGSETEDDDSPEGLETEDDSREGSETVDDDSPEGLETVDDDSSKGLETEDDDSSDCWAKVCVWVLDLAGDRKWQQRTPQSYSAFYLWLEDFGTGFGVLDGKIYKFRGSSHGDRGVLGGAIPFDRDDCPDLMPEAKVYDPRSDVWSRITPEPSDDSSGSWSDDIAPILEWARNEFGADHSKAFSADGWYEPYFSEWRKTYSSAPQSAVDIRSHNENQVYYRNRIYSGYDEFLFFFGEKLAKFTRDTRDDEERNDAVSNIELYDTQENTWKQWISLKVNSDPPFEEDSNFSIVDFASIEGVIWAVFMVSRDGEEDGKVKYHLLRSPVLLDENSDSSVSWIYTGHCLADGVSRCMVRPIYI